jgi:hypothetical protein
MIQNDLARGKAGEVRVKTVLEESGIPTEFNDDKDLKPYFDLISEFHPRDFTTEVKNDEMSLKTGNIAIEIYNPRSNHPSGLYITKANLWAHLVGDAVWITSVTNLKQFFKSTPPYRTIKRAGDRNATVVLYQMSDILPPIFCRIDQSTPRKVRNLICRLLSKSESI